MEILSSKQMSTADSLTIQSGVPGETLMEKAGFEVAELIKTKFPKKKTIVLCGPGNNGGDGFVVARLLKQAGWNVDVASMISPSSYKNDAKIMADRWSGDSTSLDRLSIGNYELVVDALFGTGLSKNIEGNVAKIIDHINKEQVDTVAIDIPSGINSDNGQILGTAINAKYTVTFARKKIGHVLYPGKKHSGIIYVADIGIKNKFIKSDIEENLLDLWLNDFPFPNEDQHKYDRGHSIVVGGNTSSAGAATLSATAALVTGSGLVTIACPDEALSIYASKLTAVMNKPVDSVLDFESLIDNEKITSVLIGPGSGVNNKTKDFVMSALKLKKNCVIDADAITVFQDNPDELFSSINSNIILTPHEGEFKKLFSNDENKIIKTQQAAKKSGCTIILKGSDTVIASPDGTTAVNTNAPPTLATAGSGDVLAGIITALLANKLDSFKAACAGVWIHSEAANIAGIGLTSEDLSKQIPKVLQELFLSIKMSP